ncbi:unnamed protein product [Mesocestoides corti]|uniref:Vegetative cell wall protein gp1-like n=1 Tax=Mesocestoides corti TaxID=53468 RepID=A0A0R3U9V9_MESCO|nr:unnamed protein product [Mesocestoides corti]
MLFDRSPPWATRPGLNRRSLLPVRPPLPRILPPPLLPPPPPLKGIPRPHIEDLSYHTPCCVLSLSPSHTHTRMPNTLPQLVDAFQTCDSSSAVLHPAPLSLPPSLPPHLHPLACMELPPSPKLSDRHACWSNRPRMCI